MRYTREINLRVLGDTVRARSLESLARTFLGQMLQQDVVLGGLRFASRRRLLPDGSLIELTHIAGLPPLVVITVPIQQPVVLEQDVEDPLWMAINDGANPGNQIKRVAKIDFRKLEIIDPDGTWPHLTLESTGLSRLNARESLTRGLDGRLINLQTGATEWTPDHAHSGNIYGSLVQWYVNRRAERMVNALYGSGFTSSPDDGDRLYTWPAGNFIKIITDPFELMYGIPQNGGGKSAISDNGTLFMASVGAAGPTQLGAAALYNAAGDHYWFGPIGAEPVFVVGAFCTDKYAAAVLEDGQGFRLIVLRAPNNTLRGDVIAQITKPYGTTGWADVAIRGEKLFIFETTRIGSPKPCSILEYSLPNLQFERRLDNVLTVNATSFNEFGSLD